MGDSSELNQSAAIALTGKIMVLAIIFLFLVVVFVLFLHLYAKWFWYRREEEESASTTRRRRRSRLEFAPGHRESCSGLDPSLLKSVPVVTFDPKEFKDGLECAVCLSDLAGGEKARLLPKCNHGFHLDCIDMWFQSHSTCPLCRNPVSTQPELTLETILLVPNSENSTDSPNFPTNVMFWGNQAQVSTLGACLEEDCEIPTSSGGSSSSSSSSGNSRPDGSLVIDIPRGIGEEDEQKSPVTTRMRSLKRLLSRDRRVNPFSLSVEAGEIGRGQS